jgi:signal transduction histidine kinase
MFSPPNQINIYRILQESLPNIVKHSLAQNISVAVKKHDDYIPFSIEDDGKDYKVKQVLAQEPPQRSLGWACMEERVMIAAGSLNSRSQAGSSSRLTFTIPSEPWGDIRR